MAEQGKDQPARKFRRFSTTGRKGMSVHDAIQRFFERRHSQENFHLLHLWDNWPMVMGDELASVAHPLGARERTLIIGAEDNMLLHELSFQVTQILARANAFMHEPYFRQVRLELLQNRRPLYPRFITPPASPQPERKRPDKLGALTQNIDPDSPAGRAYLSYVQSFEDNED